MIVQNSSPVTPDNCVTFREIDAALSLPKGSAFRAFKRLVLKEGTDYIVMDANCDQSIISELRAQGRIYRSSVNVVLLSASTAACLKNALRLTAEK